MEVETQNLPKFELLQSEPPSFPSFTLNLNHHEVVESHECSNSDFSLAFNRFLEKSPNEEMKLVMEEEAKVEKECVKPVSLVDFSTDEVQSTLINGLDESERSVSTAALKVQKVYRGYRTRRRLADSAVVAEEFWWQAINYARLNHSTISFFNFLKPETVASRWSRITLNASKVGKGITKDAKAKKLAFQHWIEAIDPRHRYGHSLHYYYDEWCKGDAGQPFFYWLDIGDGREVDLIECPRSKLRQQCIKYLGPQEREHYEYVVIEGKIVHKCTGQLMNTMKGSHETKWIFVMSTFKQLYAGEKKKGLFHHSSFLAGGATLAAGRFVTKDGVLKSISAYSGHYRPTEENLESFLEFLKENGVNLDEVEVRSSTEDYAEDNKSIQNSNSIEVLSLLTESEPPQVQILNEVEVKQQPSEPAQTDNKVSSYQRTLSGGLQSPRADVPEKAILHRINSKKAATSYQLGHQLSLKWSTGAGPRIGCVADYPLELRQQALEFVNLSPKGSLTPTSRRRAGFYPSTPRPTSDLCNTNGDVTTSVI